MDAGQMRVIGTLTLPGTDGSVRSARRFVREMLPCGHPVLEDLELCVSELFANAVAYTRSGQGGKVTIALGLLDGTLVGELTDDGADGARPYLKNAVDDDAEGGRGLHIVDALALRWGWREQGTGTTVWLEFAA